MEKIRKGFGSGFGCQDFDKDAVGIGTKLK